MNKVILGLLFIVVSATAAPYSKLDEYSFREDSIQSTIRSAVEYQLKLYGNHIPTKNWLVGTFFSSFVAAYAQTGDEWYLTQAATWGEASEWDIKNRFNADDVCPGQTYLDIFFLKGGDEKISNLIKNLEPLLERETLKAGELHSWDKDDKPFIGRNIWSWCDALYMAPPVYAQMGKATGEQRYYDQNGRPFGAFISSPSGDLGTDMRYWTARYADGQWVCEQLTHDPINNQLRPVIVRGKENALFWFAGEYKRYQEYDCSIMMSMEF